MLQKLRRARHALALVAILALAAGLRLWGLTWGLYNANVSRRPQPDEWAVYWVFRWFGTSHLNPCPSLATRHCFFDWGGVFLYGSYLVRVVLGPVYALLPARQFGPRADPAFVYAVLSGRILSVCASVSTVFLIYLLGSRVFGRNAGLVAALLAAISGLLVQLGHFATPDSTTIFLSAAALLAMHGAMQNPRRFNFMAAGALIGLAAGAEYHMILLLLPLCAAWWLSPRHRPGLLLLSGLAAVVAFAALNPYALLEHRQFAHEMELTFLMRTADSAAHYQSRFAAYDPAVLYVLRYPLGYGVGALLAAWMAAGVAFACLRRSRSDLLLLAWIGPYFLLVSVLSVKFMRYSAPLLPALTIVAAAFAVRVLSDRQRRVRLAAAALGAVSLLYTAGYDVAYTNLFAAPEPRVVAATWLQKNVAPRSRYDFEVVPNGTTNLPYFLPSGSFRPCFSQFRPRSLAHGPPYLVIDTYAFEDHPAVPNEDVARFREALGRNHAYRQVARVHSVPSFLGQQFPIDGSPNDWRYASHDIRVYRRPGASTGKAGSCFPTVSSAMAALYVSTARG